MAKKSSGLRTIIKVAKAIDKANKKAIKNSEKLEKQHEREKKQIEHLKISTEKAHFKEEIEFAKYSYEERCKERKNLRNKFVNQEIR